MKTAPDGTEPRDEDQALLSGKLRVAPMSDSLAPESLRFAKALSKEFLKSELVEDPDLVDDPKSGLSAFRTADHSVTFIEQAARGSTNERAWIVETQRCVPSARRDEPDDFEPVRIVSDAPSLADAVFEGARAIMIDSMEQRRADIAMEIAQEEAEMDEDILRREPGEMSDVEADADALASAGMGTDEDYGGGADPADDF